jgi:hypothetical protein
MKKESMQRVGVDVECRRHAANLTCGTLTHEVGSKLFLGLLNNG